MNIEQSSKEEKLKALIENMGVGADQDTFKANLVLRTYTHLDGISYDEAIQLVKENNDVLQHMSVHDPAWEGLCKMRNDMLRYASAINLSRTMGRHDHEAPVHALVSVNDITVECNFYIPLLYLTMYSRERVIMETIKSTIGRSSEWSGSLRHSTKIEFVEL